MKKLIALLMIVSFAGSVIAQNAPQQKPAPTNTLASKDKDKDKDHHHHHHHHEHHDEKK